MAAAPITDDGAAEINVAVDGNGTPVRPVVDLAVVALGFALDRAANEEASQPQLGFDVIGQQVALLMWYVEAFRVNYCCYDWQAGACRAVVGGGGGKEEEEEEAAIS